MNIDFKWIGGATWILCVDKIKIACDPVLCPKDHIQEYKYFKTKRLNNPIFDESDFKNIDLWLLTHDHEDHIDSYGLKVIDKNAMIVSHKSVKSKLEENQYKNASYLGWNEEMTISFQDTTIKIKAIPAIHAKRTYFSSKIGNGNGYIIELKKQDSKYLVYITGDSVHNSKLNKYLKEQVFDLFIVNAGGAVLGESFLSKIIGRLTNNKSDIIKLVSTFSPKVLIPVHWGTFSHYIENIEQHCFRNYPNVKVLNIGERLKLH